MNSTAKIRPELDLPADFNRILDEVAALRDDFAAFMGHVKSSAINTATDAADDAVDKLGDRAGRLYDTVASQGARSVKAIGRQVEERPVVSLLLAFGIGFIASRLLAR